MICKETPIHEWVDWLFSGSMGGSGQVKSPAVSCCMYHHFYPKTDFIGISVTTTSEKFNKSWPNVDSIWIFMICEGTHTYGYVCGWLSGCVCVNGWGQVKLLVIEWILT